MGAMLILAAAMATSSPPAVEALDVAYMELSNGKAAEAVEKLEASKLVDAGDPAALINLGTAYARTGDFAKARECYNAAMASDERYILELGNGRWVDSRDAAMMASDALARGEVLARR